MEWDPGSAVQPAGVLDLRQQLKLVEVAIHIVDRGYAVARAPVEPALHGGAVGILFLHRRSRIRLATGRETKPGAILAGQLQHRIEGLVLAQLAGGKAVLA